MDLHGWVPISLIASFNRVRQLTTDEGYVREVLNLSSVVEVGGDMVRMKEGGWERFVLPGAQDSNVDGHLGMDLAMSVGLHMGDFTSPGTRTPADSTKVRSFVEEAVLRNVHAHGGGNEGDAETEEEMEAEVEMEDDDEEDVVFVMGQESGVWSPDPRS